MVKYFLMLLVALLGGNSFAAAHSVRADAGTAYTYTFGSGVIVQCAGAESTTLDTVDTLRYTLNLADYNTYNAIPFRFQVAKSGINLVTVRLYSYCTNINVQDTILNLAQARATACTAAIMDTTIPINNYVGRSFRLDIIGGTAHKANGYIKWAMQLRRVGF